MDSKELTTLTAELARILRQHNAAALEDFVATIRATQAEATSRAIDRLRSQNAGAVRAAEKQIIAKLARQQAEELHALISAIEDLRWKHAEVAEAVLDEAVEGIAEEHGAELDALLADIAARFGLDHGECL